MLQSWKVSCALDVSTYSSAYRRPITVILWIGPGFWGYAYSLLSWVWRLGWVKSKGGVGGQIPRTLECSNVFLITVRPLTIYII